TFDAIRALTVAAARRRSLVVAIEDLHWADRTTEDFLAFFTSTVVDVPILVITTQRPGQAARWTEGAHCTSLGLEGLSERDVESLMKSVLGASQIPARILRSVIETAD